MHNTKWGVVIISEGIIVRGKVKLFAYIFSIGIIENFFNP